MTETHVCPSCQKTFDKIYPVPTNSLEPFTSVEVFAGLEAYSAIWVQKEIVCTTAEWLHIRFVEDGEERLIKMEKFDQQAWVERRQYHDEHRQPCEHEDCTIQTGQSCYMRWTDMEPESWYCAPHAQENGFCINCGLFSAGTEDFDFSPVGLCGSCNQMLEDEFGDAFEDDELQDDDYDPMYDE
jgi:hypothetical protein